MTRDCCSQLDDYFDGDLDGDALDAFLQAASACDTCRQAMQEQAELNQSLRDAWRQTDTPPILHAERNSAAWSDEPKTVPAKQATITSSVDPRVFTAFTVLSVLILMVVSMTPPTADLGVSQSAPPTLSSESVGSNVRQSPQLAANDNSASDEHANDADVEPSTETLDPPATLQFDSNLIGVVDQSDDDFTLVRVFHTVPITSSPTAERNPE